MYYILKTIFIPIYMFLTSKSDNKKKTTTYIYSHLFAWLINTSDIQESESERVICNRLPIKYINLKNVLLRLWYSMHLQSNK